MPTSAEKKTMKLTIFISILFISYSPLSPGQTIVDNLPLLLQETPEALDFKVEGPQAACGEKISNNTLFWQDPKWPTWDACSPQAVTLDCQIFKESSFPYYPPSNLTINRAGTAKRDLGSIRQMLHKEVKFIHSSWDSFLTPQWQNKLEHLSMAKLESEPRCLADPFYFELDWESLKFSLCPFPAQAPELFLRPFLFEKISRDLIANAISEDKQAEAMELYIAEDQRCLYKQNLGTFPLRQFRAIGISQDNRKRHSTPTFNMGDPIDRRTFLLSESYYYCMEKELDFQENTEDFITLENSSPPFSLENALKADLVREELGCPDKGNKCK